MADYIARLSRPNGSAVVLRPSMVWEADGELGEVMAMRANVFSQPPYYQYSPSHGAMGYRLAEEIAKELGAEVEFPEEPQRRKDVEY